MIPKIIHYCWFGKGLMPKSQVKCIQTWKKLMPDYKIMRWDENTFDYKKYSASFNAYKTKRYALVSDVCRYNVLSEYGGIYLDTDVEVFQKFDRFLDSNFFTGLELYPEFYDEEYQKMIDKDGNPIEKGVDIPKCEILTSTLACVEGNPLICELRDYYNGLEVDEDWAYHYRDHVNNDRLVARYLTKYGFRYADETQHLDGNMVVYGTGIFGYAWSVKDDFEVSYHHNAATWEDEKWSKAHKKRVMLDKFGLLETYERFKRVKNKLKGR